MATQSSNVNETKPITGTETECDIHHPKGTVTTDMVAKELVERFGGRHGTAFNETRFMLFAGGLDYYEANNKAEGCTPECTSGDDVAIYELADVLRWAEAAYMTDMGKSGRPETWVMKSNTSANGDSSGACHVNVLMPIVHAELARELKWIARYLSAFFATVPIVVGTGVVLPLQRGFTPVQTLIQGENYRFAIAARGYHVARLIGSPNNSVADGNKPLFMDRNEPHADGERFRRLQICGLDSNILPKSISLKVDLVLLLVEMYVAGMVEMLQIYEPRRSKDTNAFDAMRRVSCNWKAQLKMQWGPERRMTPLEIQWRYYGMAEKYVYGTDTPHPLWVKTLDRWKRRSKALAPKSSFRRTTSV
jgi:Pup amidohydrolase